MTDSAAPKKDPVDWAELRRRLAAAATVSMLTPEQVRAVLDERARELARPPAAPLAGDDFEAVTFVMNGETSAIESHFVQEVLRSALVTPLPGVAPPLVGVTAWRGHLLLVLDLGGAPGGTLAPEDGRTDTPIVVLGFGDGSIGLIVEAIGGLQRIPASAVHPAPGDMRHWVRGVTGEGVMILDGTQLIRQRNGGA